MPSTSSLIPISLTQRVENNANITIRVHQDHQQVRNTMTMTRAVMHNSVGVEPASVSGRPGTPGEVDVLASLRTVRQLNNAAVKASLSIDRTEAFHVKELLDGSLKLLHDILGTSKTNDIKEAAQQSTTAQLPSTSSKNSEHTDVSSRSSSPSALEVCEDVPESLGTATASPKNVKQNSYIYQRDEYDEGMTAFRSMISLQAGDGYIRAMSVVSYNLGLYYLHGPNSCAIALTYFQDSMKAIQTALSWRNSPFRDPQFLPTSSLLSKAIFESMVAVLHNIAYIYYKNGQYSESLMGYVDALTVSRQVFGPNSLAAATTMNCMGVINFHTISASTSTASSEESEMAMNLFTECLKIQQAQLGPSHPDVATTINNVGRLHYLKGDYDKALVAYREALTIRKQALGDDHLDVAAVVYNAGQTYHQLSELDNALRLYEEFLRIAKLKLPPHHRDVAIMLKCMAQVYHERAASSSSPDEENNDNDRAAKLYDESLRIGRIALGTEDHPEIAATLNKIGNLRYERGDLDGALQAYKEGLRIELITLHRNHPNIIITLGNIARIHKNQGAHQLALSKYHEVLLLQRRSLGCNHPSVATTLYNIGLTRYQMGDFEQAFDVYQQVLQIRRDAFGDHHLEVASALNSIGLTLFKQGLPEVAMESFTECLRIRRALLGDEHRDVAVILFNIGTVLLEGGDEDEAMVYLEETLRVETKALGRDHADVVLTMQHIGEIHQQRGDLARARNYFEEALQIEERLYGAESLNVARSLNHLGNLHLRNGNVTQVMSYLTRAQRLFRKLGQDEMAATVISGYELYDLSKLHPECAAVA